MTNFKFVFLFKALSLSPAAVFLFSVSCVWCQQVKPHNGPHVQHTRRWHCDWNLCVCRYWFSTRVFANLPASHRGSRQNSSTLSHAHIQKLTVKSVCTEIPCTIAQGHIDRHTREDAHAHISQQCWWMRSSCVVCASGSPPSYWCKFEPSLCWWDSVWPPMLNVCRRKRWMRHQVEAEWMDGCASVRSLNRKW